MPYQLLIVDDENTIRKGLTSFMPWDELDCVVVGTARDGLEAMERIDALKPDIVITDIKMPRANGIEVARYIHENNPHIKVIILTGYAEFDFARSALQYGVSDYVLKPISKETLLDSVKKVKDEIAGVRSRQHLSEEERNSLREQIFRELAGGDASKKTESRAKEYGVELERYCTVAFQMQKEKGQAAAPSFGLVKNAIKEQYPNDYMFPFRQHLIWVRKVDGGTMQSEDVIPFCQEMMEISRSLYGLSMLAGVSGVHQELAQLPASVLESSSALRDCFYSDQHVCIYDASTCKPQHNANPAFTSMLFALEGYLRNWDFTAGKACFADLFAQVKSARTSSFQVKSLCVQIYYICARVLIKRNLLPIEAGFLTTIESANTIHEMEDSALDCYQTTVELLRSQGKSLSPLAEKAIQHIHDHYAENLSLSSIASQIPTNPSHLSRVFKKEMGEPITEYINKIRIEKAQELLMFSDMLAYEVAEAVGFRDATYFSLVFKKLTGISTKEFKQLKENDERQ